MLHAYEISTNTSLEVVKPMYQNVGECAIKHMGVVSRGNQPMTEFCHDLRKNTRVGRSNSGEHGGFKD